MTGNPLAWIGLAGVERDDNPRTFYWQKRLQLPMVGVALLVLLGYVLENSGIDLWQWAAEWLDATPISAGARVLNKSSAEEKLGEARHRARSAAQRTAAPQSVHAEFPESARRGV